MNKAADFNNSRLLVTNPWKRTHYIVEEKITSFLALSEISQSTAGWRDDRPAPIGIINWSRGYDKAAFLLPDVFTGHMVQIATTRSQSIIYRKLFISTWWEEHVGDIVSIAI